MVLSYHRSRHSCGVTVLWRSRFYLGFQREFLKATELPSVSGSLTTCLSFLKSKMWSCYWRRLNYCCRGSHLLFWQPLSICVQSYKLWLCAWTVRPVIPLANAAIPSKTLRSKTASIAWDQLCSSDLLCLRDCHDKELHVSVVIDCIGNTNIYPLPSVLMCSSEEWSHSQEIKAAHMLLPRLAQQKSCSSVTGNGVSVLYCIRNTWWGFVTSCWCQCSENPAPFQCRAGLPSLFFLSPGNKVLCFKAIPGRIIILTHTPAARNSLVLILYSIV